MGPQTTSDLDRFTDNELCQMHLDAGKRALTHFENVERLIACMARMDFHDPEYDRIGQTMRACHEVGIEAHELQLHIGAVIRARRANANA